MCPIVDIRTKTTYCLNGNGIEGSIEHGAYQRVEYSNFLHDDSTPAGSDSCRIYQDAGAPALDLKLASVQDGKAVP